MRRGNKLLLIAGGGHESYHTLQVCVVMSLEFHNNFLVESGESDWKKPDPFCHTFACEVACNQGSRTFSSSSKKTMTNSISSTRGRTACRPPWQMLLRFSMQYITIWSTSAGPSQKSILLERLCECGVRHVLCGVSGMSKAMKGSFMKELYLRRNVEAASC